MTQSKRRNYLIDKPFQLGFIFKYLIVVLVTVSFVFAFTALYFFYDSVFGENKIEETVIIKYRRQLKTVDGKRISEKGKPLYNLDSKMLTLYKDSGDIFRVFDVASAGDYKSSLYFNVDLIPGDEVRLTDSEKSELVPIYGPFTRTTQRFFVVIWPLVWCAIAILLIITVYSLFFSHRMAGPVYRMRISLDRMLAGDYDFKIRVRKNDFFRNIVEKLEQLRIKVKNDNN